MRSDARLVTIREASALARRSPVTVRRWVQAGRVPAWRHRYSGRLWVDAGALENALEPVEVPRERTDDHRG